MWNAILKLTAVAGVMFFAIIMSTSYFFLALIGFILLLILVCSATGPEAEVGMLLVQMRRWRRHFIWRC